MSAVMAEPTATAAAVGAIALSQSPHLVSISQQALEMASLYGRGALSRTVGESQWRFRWRCSTESFTGVELRARIGATEVILGLESLDPFASACDVTRRELPAGLRAAYLNGAGAPLWQELEKVLQRAVEVLDVRLDCSVKMTAECLGFEFACEPRGIATRGFLRIADSDGHTTAELFRVLQEVSLREMAAAPLPTHLPVRWAAVVGSTALSAAEVKSLEEHDIVLVDDATHEANALGCWLGVGPARSYAGRALFRNGGQLQLVEFSSRRRISMSPDAPTDAEPVPFAEIPVNLRFELAQWSAPLAAVAALEAGSVIDLGHRIDEHAVSVWVEQRCIGKGQLVAIGEQLGVRLLSVFAARNT
jgi:type III secretion system YscQ/HrcQ family protein